MKILLASAEVAPFSKTGGLGDVAGALPKALDKEGVDVRVISPYYKLTEDKGFDLTGSGVETVTIKAGDKTYKVDFLSGSLPDSSVEAVFVRCAELYGRDGLYTDPATNDGYEDNDVRFIVFSRAVLEYAKAVNWEPDLIHCNDNHTGMIPAYIRYLYPQLQGTATLLTIHNLGYQGVFPGSSMELTGLEPTLFSPMSPFEFYGQLNFLKIGIVFSDIVNTVSEKYAEEITSGPEYGHRLEGVLNDRKADLYGILNGIDISDWNPSVDELIPVKYSVDNPSGKVADKKALLEESGLDAEDVDVPLLGMISRLANQKGFDLLAEIIDELLEKDIRFVLLGTGDKMYHDLFEEVAKKYPDKAGIHLTFNNKLAHMIEAGADIFLMPSKYEPCGLNQMYSLGYGTVPVVRDTGGLSDTVTDYDNDTGEGTGFVFSEYNSGEFLGAIERALALYRKREEWKAIMKRGMSLDFSWEASARKYIDLYEKAIEKKAN